MNVFTDQGEFMLACGQTVGKDNPMQVDLYQRLLDEELEERTEAVVAFDPVEEFDADLDILVVHIGRMLSRWPVKLIVDGWHEVMRSNMSKAVPCVCCVDGIPISFCTDCQGVGYRVIRREDGKILKPDTYSPPDLKTIYHDHFPEHKE